MGLKRFELSIFRFGGGCNKPLCYNPNLSLIHLYSYHHLVIAIMAGIEPAL